MSKQWQPLRKPGANFQGWEQKSVSDKEVDYSAIYGSSIGYGPSLEEMARSLQPTGTRRPVNWSRVTVEPSPEQKTEAKPTVGMPGDKHETRAEAKATLVTAMPALGQNPAKSSDESTTKKSSGKVESFVVQLPEDIKKIPPDSLRERLLILLIKQAFSLSEKEAFEEINFSGWQWKNFTLPTQEEMSTGLWSVGIDKQSYDETLARLYGTSAQNTENRPGTPSERIERFRNSANNEDTILQRRILTAYVNQIYSRTHPQSQVRSDSVLDNDPAWAAILDRLLREREQLDRLRDDIKQVLGGQSIFDSFPQHYQQFLSIARKLGQLSPEQMSGVKPLSINDISNSERLNAYEQYVQGFSNNSRISTGVSHQAADRERNAIPTNSQHAQPLTPVERFKQRLKEKAIAQLNDNRKLIQQAQAKYQNAQGTESLARLRQVVEADERLENTQKELVKSRDDLQARLNLQTIRERAGAPEGTGPNAAELQAQLDQTQAKLNEIFQVRGTLLLLYPASGLLRVEDVKETNNDAKLLATLNQRFESILSDIDKAAQGIVSEDIPLSQLEPLVAATLKETSQADIAAVEEYLKGDRSRENTFRFLGFLAQIGLTIAAIFTGGIAGAVMGAIAAAMGIGQAVYEFEQADDLNTVAKTGQAGGNQLLADPDAARFNYVMGWVNLVLAGIDAAGLAVEGASALGKGLKGAERIVNLPGGEVLARVTPEQIRALERSRQLQQAGKIDEATSILSQLKQELGEETYEQLQQVWQKAEETVNALPAATGIANALPNDLQGKVPITIDSTLQSKKIEVHYTERVEVKVAKDFDPNDLRLHAPTIRNLLEFKQTESWAKQLLARLKQWLSGNPQAQSKLWEAQQELEKLPNFIYDRAQKLAALPPDSSEAIALIAEIQGYQEKIYEAVGTIVRLDEGPGVGFIASPGQRPTNTEALKALSNSLGAQYIKIARQPYGLQLLNEVLSAAIAKTGNVEEGAKLAADCLRDLGDRQNLSFSEGKRIALQRLNNSQYLAKQQQAGSIAQEASQLAGGNRETRTYVEEKLGQELKGRPQLLNDPNAKAEVLARIQQRIAALEAQTPDELLDEIDTLNEELAPYESELDRFQNMLNNNGELDGRQKRRFKELTEDLIPRLETEIDYIEEVRRRKLRPELPQSPNSTASETTARFPQNATPEQVFTQLTQGNDSSFEPFYRMLRREKFISSNQELLDEIAKISYKGRSIRSVSSDLKRVYRPKVINRLVNPDPQEMRRKYPKLAWSSDRSQDLTSPAYIQARHQEFLKAIDGLNSGDRGSIAETWFQRLYGVEGNETQVIVLQSDMAKQGINLTQDRKLDEIYGDTIREQKTVSGVLVDSQNSDEAVQFRDYATLARQQAEISVNGKKYQIRKLVYVFPDPKGVKANASWMREELINRPYLSFEIFNAKGQRKIVGSSNRNELQGQALSDWLEL